MAAELPRSGSRLPRDEGSHSLGDDDTNSKTPEDDSVGQTAHEIAMQYFLGSKTDTTNLPLYNKYDVI